MELLKLLDRQERLCQQADELLKHSSKSSKPVIAAWGLMNAGKSYLLNMLTENIEKEYFKTADQRETSEIKEFVTESYIYLDTPGLDANDEDTLEALAGSGRADVVLFVHQPQGELEKNEIIFLQALNKSFGKFAENNIIFVLSKSDKESEEKIKQIKEKIEEQCQKYLLFKPKIFEVSGTRFKSGTQHHKDGLIRTSHITDLAKHIKTIADSSQGIYNSKKLISIDEMLHEIEVVEQKIKNFHSSEKEKLNNQFDLFNKTIDSLRKTNASYFLKYKKI